MPRRSVNRLTGLAVSLAIAAMALSICLLVAAALGAYSDRPDRVPVSEVVRAQFKEQLQGLTEPMDSAQSQAIHLRTNHLPPFVRAGYLLNRAGVIVESRQKFSTQIPVPTADQIALWLQRHRKLLVPPAFGTSVTSDDAAASLVAITEPPDGRAMIALIDRGELVRWLSERVHQLNTVRLDPTGHSGDGVPGPSSRGFHLANGVFVERFPSDIVAYSSPAARAAVAGSAGLFIVAVSCGYLAVRQTSRDLRLATLRATFVAGITHDLKTPLTSISLLAETLRCGRVAQDACPDVLDTIVHETQRLHQIVENALSSARIERGAHAYHPQLVTAQVVVRGAARRFDDALLAGGFGLKESYSSEPVLVRVDPDALQHAVLNLLSNAAKYSGASREIRLSVDRDDENARISVEDAGIGIEGRDHRRIFEAFYRSPGSAQQTGGAGLGLAVVRHFATAHAGRVEVVSEPGKGSRFEILLPLVLRNVSGDERHG